MVAELAKNGWIAEQPLDEAVQWLELDFEYGEVAAATSYKYNWDEMLDEEYGQAHHVVGDDRGFDYVARHLLFKLPEDSVQLNKIVRKVKTTEGKVKVLCSDGSEFEGDHLILTASIGVLKSDLIKFKPQLPAWKKEAIN